MKKKRFGQISMEYILIFSMILMIFIPTLYLFRTYAVESNEKIIQQRISQLAKEIIDTGRELYYFGPPSKSVIQLEMPPQILSMGIISLDTSEGKREHIIVFNIEVLGGNSTLFFNSDYPIAALDEKYNTIKQGNECGESLNVKECKEILLNPICQCYSSSDFNKGIKNFKLKAIKGSKCHSFGNTCMIIDEVSDELT